MDAARRREATAPTLTPRGPDGTEVARTLNRIAAALAAAFTALSALRHELAVAERLEPMRRDL